MSVCVRPGRRARGHSTSSVTNLRNGGVCHVCVGGGGGGGGGVCVKFSGKKHYEGVRFNVIS